ncbi:hypothetical protein OPQ81_004156 [Rhizoctonia solani]|nr:hypothetical protein OPQ81_004156 [Rhizoctonia solani]
MNTTFDPDEVSDREALPRTPTLEGSTSSLDDSLLQSPYSTRFLGAPISPTKRSCYPDSRIALEGNCKTWRGERIFTDSNWRGPIDLHPHGQVRRGLSSCERLELLKDNLPQSNETASNTPAPTPSCRPGVSGAKGSSPPNVDAKEPNVERDAESKASNDSRFQQVARTPSTELSCRSISPLPVLDVSSPGQLQFVEKAQATNPDAAPDPPIPHLSIVHQPTDSEPLYAPSVRLSQHVDISRPNSSILAHCDQGSLAPPCPRMTQTQCGRSALREAGIAHGSPRALAPSIPIENVPNRSRSGNFLQRLVRKTFSKSSPATRKTSLEPALSRSGALVGNQRSYCSWPTRHTTNPLFAQTEISSSSQTPTAVKAAGTNITGRVYTQPTPGGVDYTRRHTVISGHSSLVSFFGDPLVRIDPFARSGGLGATVSPTNDDSSEPFWNVPLRTNDYNTHITTFPSGETWNQSQGLVINTGETNSSSLYRSVDTKSAHRNSNLRRASRRHSTPMLGEASLLFSTNE